MGWGTAGHFSGQKKNKQTEKTWKNVEGGE